MKIHFTAAHNKMAQTALQEITSRYGQTDCGNCDVVVALGGDGHVLRTLYEVMDLNKPVFALRRTESVGFLCNEYRTDELHELITSAHKVKLHPLKLTAQLSNGERHTAHAINEVTVVRETPQSARLRVFVDGVERLERYSGDGILVATPAGSTAYNHSCGGPIMPIDANTLVMTAISGYRPRGWRYAVLPQNSLVEIVALETEKRPVRIEVGTKTLHKAEQAHIELDPTKTLTLLFDPREHLGERIIKEQFFA